MPIPLITLRRIASGLTATLAACCLAGCATDSPPKHSERLEKAAGLKVFEIDTTKGLWEKTSKIYPPNQEDHKVDATVKHLDSGLERVSMTGTNLANYLRQLDFDAHGGADSASWDQRRFAESARMYDEISHKLDSVTRRPAPDDPPLRIQVDDAFLSAKQK